MRDRARDKLLQRHVDAKTRRDRLQKHLDDAEHQKALNTHTHTNTHTLLMDSVVQAKPRHKVTGGCQSIWRG